MWPTLLGSLWRKVQSDFHRESTRNILVAMWGGRKKFSGTEKVHCSASGPGTVSQRSPEAFPPQGSSPTPQSGCKTRQARFPSRWYSALSVMPVAPRRPVTEQAAAVASTDTSRPALGKGGNIRRGLPSLEPLSLDRN